MCVPERAVSCERIMSKSGEQHSRQCRHTFSNRHKRGQSEDKARMLQSLGRVARVVRVGYLVVSQPTRVSQLVLRIAQKVSVLIGTTLLAPLFFPSRIRLWC